MKVKGLYCLLTLLLFTSNQISSQTFQQTLKLTASDRQISNAFGRSVALDGDYAIVGCSNDSYDANGVNSKTNAGSAYIFKNTNGNWKQIQKITASDRSSSDGFGHTVSISGNYIIVGAPNQDTDASNSFSMDNAGAAYLFHFNGESWEQVKKIVSSDRASRDFFGYSVSIDKDFLVVGAYNEEEDEFGANRVVDAGSAYIFKNNNGTWNQIQKVVAQSRYIGDYFGSAVAISNNRIVIGSYGEDDDANNSNYLSAAGSAHIYDFNGQSWNFEQKIVAADRSKFSNFATVVDIYGDYIIVGAHKDQLDENGENSLSDAGSAYIFKYNGETWQQIKKMIPSVRASSDHFGGSVCIDSSYAAIGCYGDKEDAAEGNALNFAGSVYIFSNSSDNWNFEQKLVSSDRAESDFLGTQAALNNGNIIISAPNEDEDIDGSTMVNGSGSVYIFSTQPLASPTVQSSTIAFSDVQETQMEIAWDNGNGSRRVVFIKEGNSGTATPTDAVCYTPNMSFEMGTQIGTTGWYCVYKGTGSSTTVTGLTKGKNYIVHVIEMNGTIGTYKYLTSTATGNPSYEASLPVELISFSASVVDNQIYLNWQTATEQNNYGFEIERTVFDVNKNSGTNNWETIRFIKGYGNSNSEKNYSFLDQYITTGKLLYRLKQIDIDGGYEYSQSIEVDVNSIPTNYSLDQNYPNPFNPTTSISFSLPKNENVKLVIYNSIGKEVTVLLNKELQSGSHKVEFNAANLSSGIYFYRIETKSFNSTKKMILLK